MQKGVVYFCAFRHARIHQKGRYCFSERDIHRTQYTYPPVAHQILSKYEAWAEGAYETAVGDVRRNGYEYINEEITFMGDMVIWVK